MNISALTAKEVLRMCEPVTDLEKRLFDLVSELQEDVDDLKDLPAQPSCDCCSQDSCDDCDETAAQIESAVDKIESGKIEDGLTILKRLM